jgi:hypothetical protein
MAYTDIMDKFRSDFLTRITSVVDANIYLDNTYAAVKDNGVYIQLSIVEGESFNISNGTVITTRYPGLMIAKVFDPTGEGSSDIEDVIEEIIEDYKNLNLAVGDPEGSVIKFRAPYATRVGRVGGEYQKNVNCPFQFDLT